eukprot:CAMPEP_0113594110 /NCGR_PEP_ID=MMETSP0015_2-20120614/38876_1 /TAXON_ID=2838 /ORGANISM="Odontella" /LENGTH=252 /DNA_ID=CAMNT_0000501033 /DNA_START=507 /DNA_END=1265 /DNA_ORIENTATION=+ /assembly_acc=CAM_ASM_000160
MKTCLRIPPLVLAVVCFFVALAVTLPIVLTRSRQSNDQIQSGSTASEGQERPDEAPGEKPSLAPSQVPAAPVRVPRTQPTPTTPVPTFALTNPPTRARPGFEALLNAAPPLSLQDWGGDRMRHNAAFRPGEAICSRRGAQYMLGLDEDGRFLWSDCTTGEERVYFRPDAGVEVTLFVMRDDASFEIYDAAGTVVWRSECDCKDEVMFYSQCLSSENLDCPYIHLRKGSKAILNYIDFSQQWITLDIHKHYNN